MSSEVTDHTRTEKIGDDSIHFYGHPSCSRKLLWHYLFALFYCLILFGLKVHFKSNSSPIWGPSSWPNSRPWSEAQESRLTRPNDGFFSPSHVCSPCSSEAHKQLFFFISFCVFLSPAWTHHSHALQLPWLGFSFPMRDVLPLLLHVLLPFMHWQSHCTPPPIFLLPCTPSSSARDLAPSFSYELQLASPFYACINSFCHQC